MSGLVHNLNHVAEAKARLIEQFKRSPNFQAIVGVLNQRWQDLEDVLWQLLTERGLDAAVGVQLDGLGNIVGLGRGSWGDDTYRLRLRAKIKLDIESGTIAEILDLFTLLTSGTNTFKVLETFPATFILKINEITAANVTELGSVLQSAKSAGVDAQVHYLLSSNTFRCCDSNNSTVIDATRGFANSASPGTGGHLVGSA